MDKSKRFLHVISSGIRFGYGYRIHLYEQIGMEYPNEIIADLQVADLFRRKYIEGHTVLLEGWNKLIT